MSINNRDKGVEYALVFEQFIEDCRAGKKNMPMKKDNTIHKTQLANILGFKQRSTFAQNGGCVELMVQAEKEFNHKSSAEDTFEERSSTVKRLEREVARLEKRVADLLVSNAELRRDQKSLEFSDAWLSRTGWEIKRNVVD